MSKVCRARRFSVWGLVLSLGLASGARAQGPAPEPFRLGVNYIPVVPAQPVSVNPGQIEVLEFFWYGDRRCYALEPYLDAWLKTRPANVVLVRVPAALNPQWDVAARAYYTAAELGLADKAQTAIYEAIHAGRTNLAGEEDFARFFQSQFGVSPAAFEQAWNSAQVNAALAQAKVLAQRYGVTGVPVLVVNGKWLTGPAYGLNDAQLMAAVNWLVGKEEAAVPAAAQ